jgi:hypothetical protein
MTAPSLEDLMRQRKVAFLVPAIARELVDCGLGLSPKTICAVTQRWGKREWQSLVDYVNQDQNPEPPFGVPSADTIPLIEQALLTWAEIVEDECNRRRLGFK